VGEMILLPSSCLVPKICVWTIFQQNINTLKDAAADPWDKPKDDGSVVGSLAQTGVSCVVLSEQKRISPMLNHALIYLSHL
jgi:hypothetical protein